MNKQIAVLAGGCFWGMEELLRNLNGVIDTEVGYCGGAVADPTYENHEGHAEAICVMYDAEILSYSQLLQFFFQIHNPTTKNRQGNDVGTSYRSAIFYEHDWQKQEAIKLIERINQSGKWGGQVVTELAKLQHFYPAENYHQDYLQRNQNGYTCHFVRPDWVLEEVHYD
jgi:peptide-methionine (S)-S-oxide reductase